MAIIEAGTNWEVVRNFVPKEIAQAAGEQALELASMHTTFSEVHSKKGLTECYVNMFQPREGGPTDTLRCNETAIKKFGALVTIHDKIAFERFGLSYSPGMIINQLAAGAEMGTHVDRNINGRTMAVKLVGEEDEVTIRDPETGLEKPFELNQGDAFEVINGKTDLTDLRPSHGVANKGTIARVSLAVASAA